MTNGEVAILNVGTGDIKLSFDPKDPAERVRAARIVKDMLRRGYALLVEVERRGKKAFERAVGFEEKTCEYVIADYDPSEVPGPVGVPAGGAGRTGGRDGMAPKHAPARGNGRRGPKRKRVSAAGARAVAVGRSAGG